MNKGLPIDVVFLIRVENTKRDSWKVEEMRECNFWKCNPVVCLFSLSFTKPSNSDTCFYSCDYELIKRLHFTRYIKIADYILLLMNNFSLHLR